MDAQKLSQPIVVNSSDALTNISNAVSNQRNIVTSFDVLMKVLVKVGDEVAKINTYMVKAQQAREKQILDLIRTMENTYSFMVSVDELKSHIFLQDIVEQILKQMIECGYFIQEYTRRNFGESDIFSDIDDQIAFLNYDYHWWNECDQLLPTLKAVEINEYNRKSCLPTTRLDVIKSITDWVTDESTERKSVLWLYGLAGSGKSTLSTTWNRWYGLEVRLS